MPDSSENGPRQVKWGQIFVTRLGISRLASLEKPSVFLNHGLRPMTSNKRMCLGTFSRLARSLATIYIFARVRIFGTLVPFYAAGNSEEFPAA